MAEIFLSYARADQAKAAAVAGGIEADGHGLWWDKRLAAGADYGAEIERRIAAADRVVVAWSASARASLWVRAEANEALDANKLVQINFDGAKPALPFNMLHFIDFRGWSGERKAAPWPELQSELGEPDAVIAPGQRRPDPGGVEIAVVRAPALQGFGVVAGLGWAALAVAIGLALAVLMVARRLISAEAFGWLSLGALVVAALLLAATLIVAARVGAGSRR